MVGGQVKCRNSGLGMRPCDLLSAGPRDLGIARLDRRSTVTYFGMDKVETFTVCREVEEKATLR